MVKKSTLILQKYDFTALYTFSSLTRLANSPEITNRLGYASQWFFHIFLIFRLHEPGYLIFRSIFTNCRNINTFLFKFTGFTLLGRRRHVFKVDVENPLCVLYRDPLLSPGYRGELCPMSKQSPTRGSRSFTRLYTDVAFG